MGNKGRGGLGEEVKEGKREGREEVEVGRRGKLWGE